MKGCAALTLFPQWQAHWEPLVTSSPWNCSYSSAEVCHLKEVLRSTQHGRHPCLNADLTCTCLESVRTCICGGKLRAWRLLQVLLRTRFCRCTLKWSEFPSCGLLKLPLSPQWPISVVLQGHFSRLSLHGAQRSAALSRRAEDPAGWWGLRHSRIRSAPPESSPKNLCSM